MVSSFSELRVVICYPGSSDFHFSMVRARMRDEEIMKVEEEGRLSWHGAVLNLGCSFKHIGVIILDSRYVAVCAWEIIGKELIITEPQD